MAATITIGKFFAHVFYTSVPTFNYYDLPDDVVILQRILPAETFLGRVVTRLITKKHLIDDEDATRISLHILTIGSL